MWKHISLRYLCNTPERDVKTVQKWVPDNLGNLEATSSISTLFKENLFVCLKSVYPLLLLVCYVYDFT